jgi:N-acetylglucosaminyldiphosphoundecaprenol N-acetyl-beta-D-mannosaminyltransferase
MVVVMLSGHMLTNRRVEFEHSPLAAVPRTLIGGLPIAALSRSQTADLMIHIAKTRVRTGEAPPLFTSANGEVLSRCASSPAIAQLFHNAALISADGQPIVAASRALTRLPLPGRVATTDLFHDVSARAAMRRMRFAIYGATKEESQKAVNYINRTYPGISIVSRSHGYLDPAQERRFAQEASALRADILWVCLGVPREQAFYYRWKKELAGVGVVKTGGGMLNFLSGTNRRAPALFQSAGLEWLFRVLCEPRRLFWRYCLTNPHALFLLLTRTGR